MIARSRQALIRLGTLAAHPLAFLLVILYTAAWAISSPQTLEWHGAATLVTLFIALLIQRAEHRDTQALHAKLDELLRQTKARTSITHIDEAEPEEIEAHRHVARRMD
ncbi:MAG: low affinity iron permease family protein [Hyphomicrobiaceae bacterium]|nr:low affinity iron permease family protein [Hyphomicrobiaceae bacterium]